MDLDEEERQRAEELLRLLQELSYLAERDGIRLTARGEGALLVHLALGHDGATAGELREVLKVGSGRVANALKSLESKGFILRRPSSADGRVVQVYLTQAGREYIVERYHRLLRRVDGVLERLGPEDSAEFLRLTRRVIHAAAEDIVP